MCNLQHGGGVEHAYDMAMDICSTPHSSAGVVRYCSVVYPHKKVDQPIHCLRHTCLSV